MKTGIEIKKGGCECMLYPFTIWGIIIAPETVDRYPFPMSIELKEIKPSCWWEIRGIEIFIRCFGSIRIGKF